MADIAKVITVIGSSPESFAKAADAAVREASKTLRGISGADVISMSAVVEGDRISEYRTTVNIAFAVERYDGSAEAYSASCARALPTASARPSNGSASPRIASLRFSSSSW